MKSSTKQMCDRFREVMLHGTLVAHTNCRDQLTDTAWEVAEKQIGHFNSIAALTFHVHCHIKGALTEQQGGPLEISDKYGFDREPLT